MMLSEFRLGDLVVLFLPVLKKPLQSKFHGPYTVLRKVGNVNYVIKTPDRRKAERLIYMNLINPYFVRDPHHASIMNLNTENTVSVEEPYVIPLVSGVNP